MSHKMIAFLILGCVVTTYGAVSYEFANVTDPELIKQGYSCLPSFRSIGPMYNGQEAYQYTDIICERAICYDGFVNYHTCGTASFDGPPNCELVEDLTKPYPKCCKTVKCS